MSNASRVPRLSEVIRDFIQSQMSEMSFAIPGRIESYDPATQRASVQPVIKRAFTNEEDERVIERLPVIPGVPVQFPQGGGFRLTFPIGAGDTGLLLFSDASLDVWLSVGGEVDPRDDRRSHMSDAIFIPGVRSFANPIADAHATKLSLGKEGGPQLFIDASEIRIGSDNGAELESASRGDSVAQYLNDLVIWTGALSLWAAALPVPFPDLPPAPPVGGFISLSVKVKT